MSPPACDLATSHTAPPGPGIAASPGLRHLGRRERDPVGGEPSGGVVRVRAVRDGHPGFPGVSWHRRLRRVPGPTGLIRQRPLPRRVPDVESESGAGRESDRMTTVALSAAFSVTGPLPRARRHRAGRPTAHSNPPPARRVSPPQRPAREAAGSRRSVSIPHIRQGHLTLEQVLERRESPVTGHTLTHGPQEEALDPLAPPFDRQPPLA